MFFQINSDIFDQFLHLGWGFAGMPMRRLGLVPIPIGVPRSISMEPFEKPGFGPSYLQVNRNRCLALQVLLNGHLPQMLLIHRLTPWVRFMSSIVKPIRPESKRCIGTKTGIKSKRCSGTSE